MALWFVSEGWRTPFVLLEGRREHELRRGGVGLRLGLEGGDHHPQDREEEQDPEHPADDADPGVVAATLRPHRGPPGAAVVSSGSAVTLRAIMPPVPFRRTR